MEGTDNRQQTPLGSPGLDAGRVLHVGDLSWVGGIRLAHSFRLLGALLLRFCVSATCRDVADKAGLLSQSECEWGMREKPFISWKKPSAVPITANPRGAANPFAGSDHTNAYMTQANWRRMACAAGVLRI